MIDHPRPGPGDACAASSSRSRKGLRAFHRLEMLHQDLRPENVMIDATGTVKIIDFGSARVAGVAEMRAGSRTATILGTAQYTAPEYFLGEAGTTRSDLFSLGVIAYQMLTGRLPYGAAVSRARTRAAAAQAALRLGARRRPRDPGLGRRRAAQGACIPIRARRYEALSEFVYDLRHPNPALPRRRTRTPLIERNPLLFWRRLRSCSRWPWSGCSRGADAHPAGPDVSPRPPPPARSAPGRRSAPNSPGSTPATAASARPERV